MAACASEHDCVYVHARVCKILIALLFMIPLIIFAFEQYPESMRCSLNAVVQRQRNQSNDVVCFHEQDFVRYVSSKLVVTDFPCMSSLSLCYFKVIDLYHKCHPGGSQATGVGRGDKLL